MSTRSFAAVAAEVVVVPPRKNGIQIVGDDTATTILDVPPGRLFAITVMSPDVQIRTLTILNSEIGVVLDDNVVLENRAEGIAVRHGARNTTVRGNNARGNHPDFCDEGVGTLVIDNTFDTVGPCGAVP
jgi:parallel beta-helix repeat protein